MSAAARGGWAVEASIGAVEALKDQLGVCRWNFVFRSIEQRAKTRAQFYYHKHISPPHPCSDKSAGRMARATGAEKERREERVKKVMDLGCWGPSTVRF